MTRPRFDEREHPAQPGPARETPLSLRFVLHRPRNAQNIGAAARALANTGAATLWVVEPEGFDRAQAARLAAGADSILDQMRVVQTLEEAIGDCVDVVFTTGRLVDELPCLTPRETAARLLQSPEGSQVALVFGDEVRGMTNDQLRRAPALATIPTVEKASLNLAQAVLVFAYEVMLARGNGGQGKELAKPGRGAISEENLAADRCQAAADERMLGLLRERAGALLLEVGYLHSQHPELILEELVRLLRRAKPTRREIELLGGATAQISRATKK